MDFDDQLIAQLNAPEHRTPTPPPPQDATTISTPPPNPTTTPSLPRPTMTAKDGESYYIKPIPSGLRAPSLSSLMQLCHTHTLHHGFDVVKKAGVKPTSSKNGKKTIVPNAAEKDVANELQKYKLQLKQQKAAEEEEQGGGGEGDEGQEENMEDVDEAEMQLQQQLQAQTQRDHQHQLQQLQQQPQMQLPQMQHQSQMQQQPQHQHQQHQHIFTPGVSGYW
ncbi:hypothetical protein D6D00_10149 [Aureobasidium pullulans]|nr:hypothetical protein D6D00_10149 [Aureobasidium pullulans]